MDALAFGQGREDDMRMALAGLAAALIAGFSYAGAGPQLSDVEKAKVESEIKTSVASFVASVNAVDADRAFELFSASTDFREATNGVIDTSREAVLAKFREVYATLRSQDRKLADEHIVVLSPDLAMYTAGGTFALTDKDGKSTPAIPIAWTFLWRREGGRWEVVNAHQSFVAPNVS